MRDAEQLRSTLRRIDGRGYRAYQDIGGSVRLESFVLHVDRVQGDPFAAPSQLRAELEAEVAGFPPWMLETAPRRVALGDYLARAFSQEVKGSGGHGSGSGSGKSGVIEIDGPGQEVLARTAVLVGADGTVEARFRVGLPARGRSVLGRQANALLLDEIPRIVGRALCHGSLDGERLRRHIESVEDQQALRDALPALGLVAFVANGAVLPRRSGIDPGPMPEATRFESPDSLETEIETPHSGLLRGLGVPTGVSLIVGGGYHGKSTLLSALELGIYDHVRGDGRERVVALPSAVKIRAEDRRRVERVDISPFIRNLPRGRDTRAFRSEDSSGSTSQAANIIEALEVGAKALFIDEDTSATNFMIRDERMQALVAPEKEPIVPFIDKARSLWRDHDVSSVLVVGGTGDYFDIADHVIMMDEYCARDVTHEAREIAAQYGVKRARDGEERFGELRARVPDPGSFDPSRGRQDVKVDVRTARTLRFGTWDIDLSAVEQLVDASQTRSIGEALVHLKTRVLDGKKSLAEALDELEVELAAKGLDALGGWRHGSLAEVRRFEIAAAMNRLRSLRMLE